MASVGNTLSAHDSDGGQTNTEPASIVSNSTQSRPTSGVRRIDVAPAATPCDDVIDDVSDDVTQSPEPPEALQCSWRPVKPGYVAANVGSSGGSGAVLIEKTVEVEDFDRDSGTVSSFRLAIPIMSRSVAIFCAVCNVISPGLGTFIAGLSISCGSQVRLVHANKINVILLNIWVALLQLTATPILLIGWIWSVMWSTNFISISKRYRDHQIQKQEQQEQQSSQSSDADSAHRRHLAVRRTTMTTTTLSLPPSSPAQPSIIVLHEPPVSPQLHPRALVPVSATPSRRRHSSRRYNSSSTAQLQPEVLLAPGVLETILIHNGSASSFISSRGGRSGSEISPNGSAVSTSTLATTNSAACTGRTRRASSITPLQ